MHVGVDWKARDELFQFLQPPAELLHRGSRGLARRNRALFLLEVRPESDVNFLISAFHAGEKGKRKDSTPNAPLRTSPYSVKVTSPSYTDAEERKTKPDAHANANGAPPILYKYYPRERTDVSGNGSARFSRPAQFAAFLL